MTLTERRLNTVHSSALPPHTLEVCGMAAPSTCAHCSGFLKNTCTWLWTPTKTAHRNNTQPSGPPFTHCTCLPATSRAAQHSCVACLQQVLPSMGLTQRHGSMLT